MFCFVVVDVGVGVPTLCCVLPKDFCSINSTIVQYMMAAKKNEQKNSKKKKHETWTTERVQRLDTVHNK